MRVCRNIRATIYRFKPFPKLRRLVFFLLGLVSVYGALELFLMLRLIDGDALGMQTVAPIEPHTVIYSQLPQDRQLFPRDIERNRATITLRGTVESATYAEILARVFAGESGSTPAGTCAGDEGAHSIARQQLNYNAADKAGFDISLTIDARLTNYQLEVCLRTGSSELLERTIEDLVAGDVFLIQGQSNANAFKRNGSTSAAANEGPFIRSFGRRVTRFDAPDEDGNGLSDDLDDLQSDLEWHWANGDAGQASGAVGQWGIRLGRRLVDEFEIPIAILNNAVSGTTIAQHQRDDSAPERLNGYREGGVYGRLLWRSRRAGVADAARALIWYQGESDTGNANGHLIGFKTLYTDWAADYPSLEQLYVHQIRNVGTFCSGHDPAVRDTQRRLGDDPALPKVRVMSTTAVAPQIAECHFPYIDGHEKIGDNLFRLIAYDLYGKVDFENVEPPNIDYAYFATDTRDEVRLAMRNGGDSLIWNNGAERDFSFSDARVTAMSGRVDESPTGHDEVVLTLNQGANLGTTIDYLGHPSVNPPDDDTRANEWVTNGNGVGLLAFIDQAIAIDLPIVQLEVLSDSLSILRGVPVLFDVNLADADGIAELRLLVDGEEVMGQTYTEDIKVLAEQIEWLPTSLGTQTVVVEARDKRNALQRGEPIELIVVNQLPELAITNPPDDSVITLGNGSLMIEVDGMDWDGVITHIELLVDDRRVDEISSNADSGPWSFSWVAPAAGQYRLNVRVLDNDGAIANSESRIVNVVESTPTPPPTPTASSTPTPAATQVPTPTTTPLPPPTKIPTDRSIYVPMFEAPRERE